MMMVTLRVRSLVWFVTGALLALAVGWVVMSAWRVDAAPGDTDATTVPITACRLVDTRPASLVGPRSTALGAEQTYTIDVRDASTECAGDVPADASGLVLNVTAAQTSQQTFLTVWDTGPWPGTSSMNPAPGPPVPNAVTTKLSTSNTFEIYNNTGSTHLIIDIVAYLTPTSLTDLDDRMSALEAVGVDQDVLDRIEALENANAALDSTIATNIAGIDSLDEREPFATTTTNTDSTGLALTPTGYVSVTVTAPAVGQVILNSTANVGHSADGGDIACAIFEDSAIPADFIPAETPGFQPWETGGSSNEGVLSGTRGFDIAAGATTYTLACHELSGGGGSIDTRNLTAIFTPAP